MAQSLKLYKLILLLVFVTGGLSACGSKAEREGAPLLTGNIQVIQGRIAYYSHGKIHIINGDGSTLIRPVLPQIGARPSWSPDGTRIVFAGGPSDDTNIYVMNADGSGVTQLTTAGGTAPFWSPDGRSIAYTPAEINNDDIYVMNADGSNARQLSAEGGYEVVWSPDGAHIAYECDKQICTVNVDGSGQQQLTTKGGSTPAWSPDGSKIAFASDGGIYVMNTDGSEIMLLTHTQGIYSYPTWSLDGTRIAFIGKTRSWLEPNDPFGYGVYVMHADGSHITRLTNPQIVEPTGRPAWSPDGLAIVFTAWPGGKRGGITDIYIVKTDRSVMARLVEDADSPVWQPQSKVMP